MLVNVITSGIRRPFNLLKCNIFIVRTLFEKPLLYSSFPPKFALQNRTSIVTITKKYLTDDKKSIVAKSSKEGSEVSASVRETVKETTKTTISSLVIIAGVGVTALLFYAIFNELFSSKSPNTVYSKAFDKCIEDPRVQDALGEPIKGHGETTRRGRRRHVSHMSYIRDNVEHMRMKFYLKGARKSGSVHLEVIEGASGGYEYRYLLVQMDEWPHKVIMLEDNRNDRTKTALDSSIETPLDVDILRR